MTDIDKDLEKALSMINKQFGDGTVMILGEAENLNISRVASGSLCLDLALGGGMPTGRVIEIYGQPSSGKTTIALLHTAEMQKTGKYAAFIDAEHAFDPELATSYGVDVDKLIINQPENGEEAMDVAEALIRSSKVGLVVVDSVSSLLPKAEAEASMEQQSIGLQARLMSKALRKITVAASEFDCSIVFINQIREKVGVLYGNPETTSGGRALAFYSSIRINVRAGEQLKKNNEIYGHVVKAKITKNKTALPFKEAFFNLFYGQGVDKVGEIGDLAVTAGFIKQAGAWFSYIDKATNEPKVEDGVTYKWQGKEKLIEFLRETPEFVFDLEDELRGVA